MSDLAHGQKLGQDLDAALAAYQRHFGRPKTLDRIRFMLDRSEQAQRVMDDASEPHKRAAE